MKKPVAYSGATCTCTVCGRVLWAEDGPTCEDCLVTQALNDDKESEYWERREALEAAQDDAPKPVADVPAPKKRGGCCGSS